jgi:hypothetical protein
MPQRNPLAILAAIPFLFSNALGEDKHPKAYPLHGTVTAMRTETHPGSTPVYTDPYGKTRGGGTVMHGWNVYTIRTPDMEYDVSGHRKDKFTIGEQVDFRCERGKVFVKDGDREKRLDLEGQRMRDQPATPQPQH